MEKQLIRRLAIYISVVAVLLAADLIVKQVVFTTLAGRPDVVVIPGFWSFHYTANDDIGFSILRFLDGFLSPLVKRIVIVSFQFIGVGVATFFFFSPKNYLGSWVKRLPLAMIAAGGLGNAIDRIIRGFVVDYVHWYIPGVFSWPIFNLADTYTVVAVFIIIVLLLFTKEEKKTAPVPSEPGRDEPPQE